MFIEELRDHYHKVRDLLDAHDLTLDGSARPAHTANMPPAASRLALNAEWRESGEPGTPGEQVA